MKMAVIIRIRRKYHAGLVSFSFGRRKFLHITFMCIYALMWIHAHANVSVVYPAKWELQRVSFDVRWYIFCSLSYAINFFYPPSRRARFDMWHAIWPHIQTSKPNFIDLLNRACSRKLRPLQSLQSRIGQSSAARSALLFLCLPHICGEASNRFCICRDTRLRRYWLNIR